MTRPLIKFATPIGFASWGELSSPTRGEEGRESSGASSAFDESHRPFRQVEFCGSVSRTHPALLLNMIADGFVRPPCWILVGAGRQRSAENVFYFRECCFPAGGVAPEQMVAKWVIPAHHSDPHLFGLTVFRGRPRGCGFPLPNPPHKGERARPARRQPPPLPLWERLQNQQLSRRLSVRFCW